MRLNLRARRVGRPIHASGFTLIEILIALLVLSIGLLGLAAVQFQSLQNSHASYERSMATMQARDLVERLWAGICDLYNEDGTLNVDEIDEDVTNVQATIDLIVESWEEDHFGDEPNSGATFAKTASGWTAGVEPGTNVWRITIEWTGRAQGQQELIEHLFQLPPPPNYNKVCLSGDDS